MEAGKNLTAITWGHAINSQAELKSALSSKFLINNLNNLKLFLSH